MKKTIIIVDDEMPSREMLKELIYWDETEYEIIGEFLNGKDALDFYINNQVDYIITDIQMPVMNGIDFIKNIKEVNPNQGIIILSCHEKFSYAREAMKYGVKDYLIKDMLTKEDILEALAEVKPSRENDDYSEAKDYRELEYTINEILFNNTNYEYINIHEYYYVIMVLKMTSCKVGETHNDDYKKEIFKKISSCLVEEKIVPKGLVTIDEDDEVVLMLPIDQIASQIKYIYDCQKYATKIRNITKKILEEEIAIGISYGFKDLNKAKHHYEEAKKVCEYRIFLGNDKNLFVSTVSNQMKTFNPKKLDKCLGILESNLYGGNYQGILDILPLVYEEKIQGFMQYHYIKYVNAKILSLIIHYINEEGISYMNVFGKDFIPLNELEDITTVEEIIIWFKMIINNIVQIKEKQSNEYYSLRVLQTQGILKEKFKMGIGLQEVAEELGVHKVYLSRIFKEETGKTITQYIQELRIDEIKKLLETTNKSMSEIAEELNYNYPQQLSMMFKKEINLTPKEYRKQYYQKKGLN